MLPEGDLGRGGNGSGQDHRQHAALDLSTGALRDRLSEGALHGGVHFEVFALQSGGGLLDMPWEPKEAFHAVASFYASQPSAA